MGHSRANLLMNACPRRASPETASGPAKRYDSEGSLIPVFRMRRPPKAWSFARARRGLSNRDADGTAIGASVTMIACRDP